MRMTTRCASAWKMQRGSEQNIIQFTNCKGGYFSTLPDFGLRVEGDTLQDGTQTVRRVKAGSKIRCCGENLFSGNPAVDYTYTYNGITIAYNHITDVWTAQGTCSGLFPREAFLKYTLPPGTYTYSIDWLHIHPDTQKNSNIFQSWDITSGSFVSLHYQIGTNIQKVTFTVDKYTTVRNRLIFYEGGFYDISFRVMLACGGTMKDYQRHIRSEIVVPCDLYEGDVWYPMTGVVERMNGTTEQYPPQPIFANAGTVNLLQEPLDLPAKLSATMMTRR